MSKFLNSSAQLDTVHCEDSSTMLDETQPWSSQSAQGTDNILSGPEGETDTMFSQSSQSTLPQKKKSVSGWMKKKSNTLNDRHSMILSVL